MVDHISQQNKNFFFTISLLAKLLPDIICTHVLVDYYKYRVSLNQEIHHRIFSINCLFYFILNKI